VSAESDFRALLTGAAGVTALVGTRIAANAVKQGAARPYIVFSAAHEPVHGLDNTVHADKVTFTVECWAETAIAADQVADAVAVALATAGVVVVGRATGYDVEAGADATVLTVEWWD
jgi:hypothetical protein